MTSKPQTVVHFCFKKIWTQFLMTKIQAFGKRDSFYMAAK